MTSAEVAVQIGGQDNRILMLLCELENIGIGKETKRAIPRRFQLILPPTCGPSRPVVSAVDNPRRRPLQRSLAATP